MSPENLSRRALVASAAALPAIAVMPAIAAAAANPDGELIALGEELKALQPAYQASIIESCERCAARTVHRSGCMNF